MGMALQLATAAPTGVINVRPRILAFLSSILVTGGAILAALVALTALVVLFPLMLAASVTVRPRSTRRGWTELEPVEA